MDISKSKILVTGGAGFIGSHVVEALLAAGVGEVVVFDNLSRGSLDNLKNCISDERCKFYPHGADIRSVDLIDDAIQGCHGVIHLAAMWLLHCQDFPRTAFEVNIQGTFNILDACMRHSIDKIVFSSSASVYGTALNNEIDETHPLNCQNFYGATKISGEVMCRAYFEQYGLSYIGLRYMNVYGPKQDQKSAYTSVIPKLLNQIGANQHPKIFGDGEQKFDFISVEDVARANVLALTSSSKNMYLNIGTGVGTSIVDLVDIIMKMTKSSLKPKLIPYPSDDARKKIISRVASVNEAEKHIDFSSKTELANGLKKLIEWRCDNLEKKND